MTGIVHGIGEVGNIGKEIDKKSEIKKWKLICMNKETANS